MSNFPYDRRFVYPSKQEATEAIVTQANRINLVLGWLHDHKAPQKYEILTLCSTFPSETPQPKCMNYVRFEGIDDDAHETDCMVNLWAMLSRPDIALVDLSRRFGSADPEPLKPWNRKPSKLIVLERWIEPEPFIVLPPVPRPFGPHPDQFAQDCMLSNSSDQFKEGAQWTEPDETLWQKEQAYRGFVQYFRWRQISTV